MPKILYVTSLKGGTGVTTVCVGLGLALACRGERTLVVDGDNISACAMTVAGLGNMQVYTLADYEKAACRAKQAYTAHPKAENLCVMPTLGLKDRSTVKKAVDEVGGLFDYVLLDKAPAFPCDGAIIVSEPFVPSVKSADSCKAALADGGIKDIFLIVNKVNGGQVLGGEILPAESIAGLLKLDLLAVIPEDPTLPAGGWRKRTLEAFDCAAAAVCGKNTNTYDVLRGYSGLNGFIKRKMRTRI